MSLSLPVSLSVLPPVPESVITAHGTPSTTPGARTRTGHTIGGTYRSTYWRETYTVVCAHPDGYVTVYWHGDGSWANPGPARHTSHLTAVGDDKQLG